MESFLRRWKNRLKKHWAFSLVLLLGCVNGFIFVFLIPAWQHYDEPTQFEFAWLIANQPGLPKPGTYDQAMRRELAASMIEHDFFRGMGFKSNLLSGNEPVWIGISQINNAPLYYWLAALPLRLIRGADITFQLYVARLVSLLLYLVIILASYGVMVELVPPGHPLRWMVPATLALLASFTNLMTAVNDDVGATAVLSLLLWVSVVLIRRGFSWLYALELLVLVAAGLYTKSTIAFAAFLILPILLFSVLRGSKRWIAWTVLGVAAISGMILTFDWGEPALWYRTTPHSNPDRISDPLAPLGSHALAIILDTGAAPSRMAQIIPDRTSQALRGKEVSLGMWVWASKPAQIRSPIIDDGVNPYAQTLKVGETPSYFVIHTEIHENSKRLQIILSPQPPSEEDPITIYYDGMVLATGGRPSNSLPEFDDVDGQIGVWGGKPFNNAIRNASFEKGWLKARPWVDRLFNEYSPVSASLVLTSLIDLPVSNGYFLTAGKQIFRSFWGKFGWGQVSFYGGRPYLLLLILTLISLGGGAIGLIRNRRILPWEIMLLMGAILLFTWGTTLMRGINAIFGSSFVPSAHYASPAIIPTLLILCAGWIAVGRLLKQRMKIPSWVWSSTYWVFLAGLEAYSITSVLIYYHG